MAPPSASADRLAAVLDRLPAGRDRLLENLGELHRAVGPVMPDAADALADRMNLRRGAVDEVVSFYAYLRTPLEQARVCTGPMCDCLGASVPEGALEVPCLGHCDAAPYVLDGDDLAPHRANRGPSIDLFGPDRPGPLAQLTPEAIVAELRASGLVGMGGAGFPTWRKWEAVRAQPGPRAVVVNADEGEPGTFKDRYVIELRPHLLLDGIEIARRFAEADEAIVYIREEYATAAATLTAAVAARELPVRIVRGAGSYVCGEETALLESLEGRRGMPRLRPPFPAQSGYLGMPTLIDNVETLAHVPAILRAGGAAWAPGTRLWSVSGCVAEPGCYEAPNGVTLRELIDLAGGATDEIGAIVPGGAASGILPPAALDVALTPAALRPWSASVGSGAVQVFPAGYPVLRLLERTLGFFAEESCQKCTPCRIGTRATLQLVRELHCGRPSLSRSQLEAWLVAMERLSICGLGQAAPLPLRAAMRHWPDLFEAVR